MEKVARLPVSDPESRLSDLSVTEIFRAGWVACEAAMAAKPRHLTLAGVTDASVTAIRQASA